MRIRSRGGRWTAAVAACLVGAVPLIRGDVRPLTLYQKVARATLVVRARATSDSTRRPAMIVLEVYKGFYPGKLLTIVPFFQDYSNPRPWLHREVFKKDEESILFLVPYEPDKDSAFEEIESPKGDDETRSDHLFALLNADQGKIEMPSEGASALTSTLHRISEILSLAQSDLQSVALRGLLADRNPYLVEAGLDEVARYDLAREEDVAALFALLTSPRVDFREKAMRILGQISAAVRSGSELHERAEIFTHVVDRAYKDAAPSVRSEAVRTLARMRGEGVAAVLDAVRTRDADQSVRYEAGVALLGLAETGARP
jgi:hypothetical protein